MDCDWFIQNQERKSICKWTYGDTGCDWFIHLQQRIKVLNGPLWGFKMTTLHYSVAIYFVVVRSLEYFRRLRCYSLLKWFVRLPVNYYVLLFYCMWLLSFCLLKFSNYIYQKLWRKLVGKTSWLLNVKHLILIKYPTKAKVLYWINEVLVWVLPFSSEIIVQNWSQVDCYYLVVFYGWSKWKSSQILMVEHR